MGGLAMLIVYTVLIGLIELQFDVTVGEVVSRLLDFLTGG